MSTEFCTSEMQIILFLSRPTLQPVQIHKGSIINVFLVSFPSPQKRRDFCVNCQKVRLGVVRK